MNTETQRCFLALQQAVERRFHEAHAPFDLPIADWKGQDIVAFQEHLRQEVQGQVSEKWFYTHVKQSQDRLPRIDVLNLLSAYVGEQNWASFVAARREAVEEVKAEAPVAPIPLRSKAFSWKILALSLGLLVAGGWLIMARQASVHRFCFVSADTGLPLQADQVEVWQVLPGESLLALAVQATGCVEVKSSDSEIRLIMQGSYFLSDTLIRQKESALPEETIPIYTDDYAQMIHYFSSNQLDDWQKRRRQLEEMFADQARIIQIDPQNQYAMEMYNKAEFVNKLSLPIRSLGQIEVLETRYEGPRIVYLRFYQREP
jgi:hypothetical protein